MSWQDSVDVTVSNIHIQVALSDDLNGWSDSLGAYAPAYLNVDAGTDDLNNWEDTLQQAKSGSLSDDMNNWGDSLGVTLGATHYEHATLLYSTALMEGRSGWFLDIFSPPVMVHYGDEGKDITDVIVGDYDGNVYLFEGSNDNGNPIPCNIRTASRDQGDLRYKKLYGDIMLDCNTQGVDVSATAGFDEFSWNVDAVTVNEAGRDMVPVTLGSTWRIAQNVALDLSWAHNGGTQEYFYIWEPRFTQEGGRISAYTWDTSYLTYGLDAFFYHGWLYLVHMSTADLTFSIMDETEVTIVSITITNSGGLHQKDFIRLPVLKGKLFRYSLTSTAEFRVEGEESELLVKQWGIGGPWRHERIFQDIAIGEAQ